MGKLETICKKVAVQIVNENEQIIKNAVSQAFETGKSPEEITKICAILITQLSVSLSTATILRVLGEQGLLEINENAPPKLEIVSTHQDEH